MPVVSIIIPTYNRQHLVQETIDSVFRQTYTDWELIVVDDGSIDDTRGALGKRYGSSIRYIYQNNQGESAARNRGIAAARGTYVAFLDSDDLWLPSKLQIQVDLMDADANLGLVSTQSYWMNHEGLRLKRLPQGHEQATSDISWADLVLGNAIAGGGSTAMVRRRCFELAGAFDTSIHFGEEWDLWLRIARHFKARQISEPLSFYRINPGGQRNWAPRRDEAAKMHADHLEILGRAFDRCPYSACECKRLRALAYSQAHLRHAFASCGLGTTGQGYEQWLEAIKLCPEYATDHDVLWQRITDSVAGFASAYAAGERIDMARAMLERILYNPPAQVQSLARDRERLLARIMVELAFQAAQNKESCLARRCALESIVYDPSWIQNRGLVQILLNGGRHLWPDPIDWEQLLYEAGEYAGAQHTGEAQESIGAPERSVL